MYILMHKDVPVVECRFNDGYFGGCGKVLNQEHLPIGTVDMFGFSNKNLADWFGRRMIPKNRQDLGFILPKLYNPSTNQLMLNSYACNLSDTYWIKPECSDVTWRDINFLENSFSKNLGDLFLQKDVGYYQGNAIGPDSATPGNLLKAWREDDRGRRLLLKASTVLHQEPYNEIIGSRFCRMAGIKAVKQGLLRDDGRVYSWSECMVSSDTELVTAWDVCKQFGKLTNVAQESIQDYRKILESHGVSSKSIDDMIIVDFLMRNTDRHWSNFGIIRDANTLEWKSTIPLFDFGNSLWYNDLDLAIRIEGRSALTGMSVRDDLQLVKSCTLSGDIIDCFQDICENVLSTAKDVDKGHIRKVLDNVQERTDFVKNYFDLSSSEKGKGVRYDVEYH